MQFVRNSYTLNPIPLPQDREGVLKHIEAIGRLCYRSDDNIAEGSAEGFVSGLKRRKHWAMLEHYIFTLSISKEIYDNITDPKFYDVEKNADFITKMKFVNLTAWKNAPEDAYKYMISGSATSFNYLWECECVKSGECRGMEVICEFLRWYHPVLMMDPLKRTPDDHLQSQPWYGKINFVPQEEIRRLPKFIRLMHQWMSVHFVVERSSTHDIVRHRAMTSFGQESTRYCNYDKKGMCFVIPCQFSEHDKQILEDPEKIEQMAKYAEYHRNIYGLADDAYEWFLTLVYEANRYTKMLNEFGWSPQESKGVLGHALRAEINVTTYMGEWHHIFNMRADRAAFPQIQEVMVPLLNECIHKDSEIFGDLIEHVVKGAKFVNGRTETATE